MLCDSIRNKTDHHVFANESALNLSVIVKKSAPKNLSVDCRSTVGRHITDSLPTGYRQATDSFPKKKIVEKTRIKHDIETIFNILTLEVGWPHLGHA